jgi:hypothetical protein
MAKDDLGLISWEHTLYLVSATPPHDVMMGTYATHDVT